MDEYTVIDMPDGVGQVVVPGAATEEQRAEIVALVERLMGENADQHETIEGDFSSPGELLDAIRRQLGT